MSYLTYGGQDETGSSVRRSRFTGERVVALVGGVWSVRLCGGGGAISGKSSPETHNK